MNLVLTRPRVLPSTIIVMGLLLALKSVGLLRVAISDNAAAAETPSAQAASAAPESSAAASTAAASPTVAAPGAAGPVSPAVPPKVAMAPPPSAPPAPVSTAERGLLLDLRHRREMLDARAREQEQRDEVMAAAEKKLAARVAELNALQSKLEALEAARESHDSANWASLVHIYETMKPRDAATIFDALDMQVLLGVLDRMSTRKAAPILAAMQPERARLATQMLAELRTRAVTPAGEPPAGIAGVAAGLPQGDKSTSNASDPKG